MLNAIDIYCRLIGKTSHSTPTYPKLPARRAGHVHEDENVEASACGSIELSIRLVYHHVIDYIF